MRLYTEAEIAILEARRKEVTLLEAQRLWVLRNRGVLMQITDRCNTSYSMVRAVLYNGSKSTTGCIERELATRGAPGFEAKAKKAS